MIDPGTTELTSLFRDEEASISIFGTWSAIERKRFSEQFERISVIIAL